MIDLCPGIDLAMEIACTIPKEPAFVLRAELAEDFWPDVDRVVGKRKLVDVLDRLRKRGFAVNGMQAQHRGKALGLGLQVMDEDWREHSRKCEVYMNQRCRKREKVA